MSDILSKALGSQRSGNKLGSSPTKREIRQEVNRLKKQGKDGMEIGKQIGVFYTAQKDTDTLDKLEEVLEDEFEDYGD